MESREAGQAAGWADGHGAITVSDRGVDALTGLLSMHAFRESAQAAMDNLGRRSTGITFAYFNLENFRAFNEAYGFSEGDALLRKVGSAIAGDFPDAICSRLSGDKFALYVCGVPLDELTERLEEVHERVHDFEHALTIELKMGVFELVDEVVTAGVAYDRAKVACDSIAHIYDANYRVYDQELGERLSLRQHILNTFDTALEKGYVRVYYQPVQRAFTGRICGFEALARWVDPERGFLSPADFVPVLEDSHLVYRLDSYVIQRVCEHWREVRERGGHNVPISVNLSRLDLQLANMLEVVEAAVRANGMPRRMLHIEITESALSSDRSRLVREVMRFREAGYQVWLDDFGSGYSSFSSLKDCEFDVAKIDMDFLRDFESRPKSRSILSSIVDLSKRLGMQTLTEGVETEAQREFLRDIGCEMLQGYLIGRPQDFETTLALVGSGELDVEDYGERGYLDAIGHVNILSPTPFALAGDGEARKTHEQLPLAVLERQDGALRYVSANRTYVELLEGIGISSLEESEARLNDPTRPQSHAINSTIGVARANRATETSNILEGDSRCTLRVRFLSSTTGKESYLVSLDGLSDARNMTGGEMHKVVSDYVCSLYDSVDLLDLEEKVLYNVLRSGSDARAEGANPDADDALRIFEFFATEKVHPADRGRFARFADISTLRERVARTHGTVTEAVRVRRVSGGYVWKMLGFSTAESERYVVFWMREFDEILEDAERATRTESISLVSSPSTILSGIDAVSPVGFFWKDARRRYLGATTAFEELFGVLSPDDYVGKSDSEMGWLPDDASYEAFERGLADAPTGVCGEYRCQCVVNGTLHDIVCREAAVFRAGCVEGYVGCTYVGDEPSPGANGLMGGDPSRATPAGPSPAESESANAASVAPSCRDEVTDLLDVRGFLVAEAAYADAFTFKEKDFAIAMVGIENLREIVAVFGRSHGNRVLAEVARRLREACGRSCVLARTAGAEFAILTQTDERRAVEDTLERAGKAIVSIDEVDGHPCSLLFATGFGFFSEARGLESLMRLVSNRMRDGVTGMRLKSNDGVERMTHEDAVRRVQLLQPYFTTVRIVDPSCARAQLLDEKGRGFAQSSCCYGVWKANHRCVNCVSARTLANRAPQSKYEFRDDEVFYVNTQYVEVDGEPRVIEMVRALDFGFGGASEGGKLLHSAVTERDALRYVDMASGSDAGVFNRAYFDDIMAALTSQDVVVVGVLATGEDGASRHLRQREMVPAALGLRACVRPSDTVIRYDADKLMVIFDQALPAPALEGRLRAIQRRVRAELRREFPMLEVSLTVVAVSRRAKVSVLAQEATRLVGSSRESGEPLAISRG